MILQVIDEWYSHFSCSGIRVTGYLHTKLQNLGHTLPGDKSVSQFLVKLVVSYCGHVLSAVKRSWKDAFDEFSFHF